MLEFELNRIFNGEDVTFLCLENAIDKWREEGLARACWARAEHQATMLLGEVNKGLGQAKILPARQTIREDSKCKTASLIGNIGIDSNAREPSSPIDVSRSPFFKLL